MNIICSMLNREYNYRKMTVIYSVYTILPKSFRHATILNEFSTKG